jgi:hypothetical protein
LEPVIPSEAEVPQRGTIADEEPRVSSRHHAASGNFRQQKRRPFRNAFILVEQFLGCVFVLAINSFPIGFNVAVFALHIVSGIANSVFYFSHSISCLTLGLVHSTLRLGLAVACPFAHLAFGAPGNVFRFSLNTILVHEFILPFVALMFICNVCLDNRSSSRDQLENQCDQSQHKQNVNKTTHGVTADYSQQPQNKQHYENCPKHNSSPSKAVVPVTHFDECQAG